jgi:hypothetical protein
MQNNNIPRPNETTYYQNKPQTQQNQFYAQLWDLIAEKLCKNTFVIKVPEHICLGLHINQLNADLKSYGWVAEHLRVKKLPNGYDVIYLTPLKDEK